MAASSSSGFTDPLDDIAYLLHLPTHMTARHTMKTEEMCINDDWATALVVDPVLGFTTHKMGITEYVPFGRFHSLRNDCLEWRNLRKQS
uniref:[histone H4]-N-methyl-L-lysine(20) N-methyltransferase n=1 Tax=Steinernema glaseri TaxID=37863 RepID=A0A1I7ZJ95_9BILA